jgi:hypothetical protein
MVIVRPSSSLPLALSAGAGILAGSSHFGSSQPAIDGGGSGQRVSSGRCTRSSVSGMASG